MKSYILIALAIIIFCVSSVVASSPVYSVYLGTSIGKLTGTVTTSFCSGWYCYIHIDSDTTINICPSSKGSIVQSGKIKSVVCQSGFNIQTKTDANGVYNSYLSWGNYIVSTNITPPATANVPSTIRVYLGQVTTFNITIDSGSR